MPQCNRTRLILFSYCLIALPLAAELSILPLWTLLLYLSWRQFFLLSVCFFSSCSHPTAFIMEHGGVVRDHCWHYASGHWMKTGSERIDGIPTMLSQSRAFGEKIPKKRPGVHMTYLFFVLGSKKKKRNSGFSFCVRLSRHRMRFVLAVEKNSLYFLCQYSSYLFIYSLPRWRLLLVLPAILLYLIFLSLWPTFWSIYFSSFLFIFFFFLPTIVGEIGWCNVAPKASLSVGFPHSDHDCLVLFPFLPLHC